MLCKQIVGYNETCISDFHLMFSNSTVANMAPIFHIQVASFSCRCSWYILMVLRATDTHVHFLTYILQTLHAIIPLRTKELWRRERYHNSITFRLFTHVLFHWHIFLLNFHYAICVMQGYDILYPDELVFSLIYFFVSLQYHTCVCKYFWLS